MLPRIKIIKWGRTSNGAINFEFTFHNVGQGLFYSGRIANINFIYDCGAFKVGKSYKKPLSEAVEKYVERLPNKTIDFAVVSHMDEDHVNGFEKLLRHDVAIHDIILPYLNPTERLVLALADDSSPRWYEEFLASPVAYFKRRGAQRIIFIGGEGGEKEGNPDDTEPIKPKNEKLKVNFDDLEDDSIIRIQIEIHEPELVNELGSSILAKSHRKSITANDIWLFRFFNYKENVNIDEFNERAKEVMGDINANTIYDSLANGRRRKELRDCYKNHIAPQLKGGINSTSIVLYHGALKPLQYDIWNLGHLKPIKCVCDTIHLFLTLRDICAPGQLLTGDINLEYTYNELITHFSNHLDSVGIMLVPHHGSIANWNGRILEDLKNCVLFISSAGVPEKRPGNKQSHPAKAVVAQIESAERCFISCTEERMVKFRGKVHLDN